MYSFLVFALYGLWALAQARADEITDFTPPKADQTQKPPKEIVDAIDQFKQRRFDEALKLFQEYVKKTPDQPPAEILMAQLCAQTNQAYLMREYLERTVINTPEDPEAYVIFGEFAMRDRRVTEAALLFAKAKELLAGFDKSPNRKKIVEPRTIDGLASVAEARGKWVDAQAYLETLLTLLPKKDTPRPMQRLARALFQQKKATDALHKLQDAYAIDSKSVARPEAILALLYHQCFEDEKNAKLWMDIAVSKAPGDLRTQLTAAQWALEIGKIEEAQTHAAAAMGIDANSFDAKMLRGVVCLFQKDFEGAEKYFKDAHLQIPSSVPASNNLALALCEQKDTTKKQQAVQYAEANFRQNQQSVDAASTLGWVYYKNSNLEQAQQLLSSVARTGNLSQDTAYYLSQVLYDLGHKPEAKQFLEAMLKMKRPFSMRPDATKLLEKIRSEPAPKAKEKE
jgi:tetratricopeptide (TPR) repeat protein